MVVDENNVFDTVCGATRGGASPPPMTIIGVRAHMHKLGTATRIERTGGETGEVSCLVNIPRYELDRSGIADAGAAAQLAHADGSMLPPAVQHQLAGFAQKRRSTSAATSTTCALGAGLGKPDSGTVRGKRLRFSASKDHCPPRG